MIDTTLLLAVYGAFLVGLISPGPDFVLVTALSLQNGKRLALQAALGIAAGVGLWVIGAALGLAQVMQSAPEVWEAVRLIGGGVLIYMGSKSISSAIRGTHKPETETEPSSKKSPFLLGLLTNVSNPKAAIVLVGLTTVLSEAASDKNQALGLVLGMPILAMIWFSMVATVLSNHALRDVLVSRQRIVDAMVGIALAGVGIILLQSTPSL